MKKWCNKFRLNTEDGITIAVSKTDEDVVVATKKALLEKCLKCEYQDDCKDAVKMHKQITQ